jgi:hypothetical protein
VIDFVRSPSRLGEWSEDGLQMEQGLTVKKNRAYHVLWCIEEQLVLGLGSRGWEM